jgi:glycosyltransferase involved in cell wall biosynthesis
LISQDCENWKAIVNFDGIDNPSFLIFEDRIKYIFNKPIRKFGGIIRNQAIRLADTEWIGFVDDDDALEPHYISALKQEIKSNPDLDCVVFRMKNELNYLVPHQSEKTVDDIKKARVGISFCFKKKIFDEGIRFVPGSTEDFDIINKIRSVGYKIILSKFCVYRVKPKRFFYKSFNKKIKLI